MNIYTPSSDRVIHATSADLSLRTIPRPIHLVQYDSTLPILAVSLSKDNSRYLIPDTITKINIRVGKPDNTFVYNPCLGISSDKNTVYFEVTQQMTSVYGEIKASVELCAGAGDSEIAQSGYIVLQIEENPIQEGMIESESEFETVLECASRAERAASNAKSSETNAENSSKASALSATEASKYKEDARIYMNNASACSDEASEYEDRANTSALEASTSASEAATSAANAEAAKNRVIEAETTITEASEKLSHISTDSTELTINSGNKYLTLYGNNNKDNITLGDGEGVHLISDSGDGITFSVNGQDTSVGNTDISSIGDGSITGAIKELSNNSGGIKKRETLYNRFISLPIGNSDSNISITIYDNYDIVVNFCPYGSDISDFVNSSPFGRYYMDITMNADADLISVLENFVNKYGYTTNVFVLLFDRAVGGSDDDFIFAILTNFYLTYNRTNKTLYFNAQWIANTPNKFVDEFSFKLKNNLLNR